MKARQEFLNDHPPNHQGYYICSYCPKWIPANEITIDHIVSRSRAPHLRYVQSNLCVACWDCNGKKGSGEWLSTVLPEVELEELPWYY